MLTTSTGNDLYIMEHFHLGDISDAASVNPEVVEVTLCSLLTAKYKLAISLFLFASTVNQVRVCEILAVQIPGVRENRTWRDVAA
jgi:hypothetical protein